MRQKRSHLTKSKSFVCDNFLNENEKYIIFSSDVKNNSLHSDLLNIDKDHKKIQFKIRRKIKNEKKAVK